MNILGSSVDSDDDWYKWYLNINQVNKKAINTLENKDIEFDDFALDNRSATICYIVSKILKKYFYHEMQQQKIIYQDYNL